MLRGAPHAFGDFFRASSPGHGNETSPNTGRSSSSSSSGRDVRSAHVTHENFRSTSFGQEEFPFSFTAGLVQLAKHRRTVRIAATVALGLCSPGEVQRWQAAANGHSMARRPVFYSIVTELHI